MVSPKSFFSSSLFFLFAATATAQASPSFNEADELLLFQDMDLVVSASRLKHAEKLSSVPVTVLTAEDLHYGGHTSIEEALRFVPGVDIVRMDRNRYGIGIRGLEGLFSDRMMTLVDGMPADSPGFGGPEFSSLPLMMEDIERIEIVRGPGGAAWGSNALTGVINIITKDPGKEQGMFVTSTVTEFGDNASQVRFADSTEKWRYSLSAGYDESKSSGEVFDLDDDEGLADFQRRILARTALIYEMDSSLEVSFGAGLTSTESGAFETSGLVTSEDNELETVNGYFRVGKEFSAESEGYLRWAGRYQDKDRPSYGEAKYTIEEHDFEGQLTLDSFTDHALAVGGNFRTTNIDSRPVEPGVLTLADENLSEQWLGIFASDRYQYSRQLGVEIQARTDWYSEGDVDWSGRISTLYGLDSNMDHILRFSGAKSFRQPVGFIRDALYFSGPEADGYEQYFSVDSNIDSEQAWSLEAGYFWNIQEQVTLKTDLYYMWYENLIGAISEIGETASGYSEVVTQVTNTGDAEGFGCEIELNYESGPVLCAVWYAFNDFETEHEYQSIRAFLPAQSKVGFTVRWLIDENWVVNGQYAYSSSMREDISDKQVSSSNHMDLTLSRKIVSQNGEVMVGVRDLFTSEYEPLVGLDQTIGAKIPGRTFFARLQYTF
jgi:iron complex outermembrane receptor protein